MQDARDFSSQPSGPLPQSAVGPLSPYSFKQPSDPMEPVGSQPLDDQGLYPSTASQGDAQGWWVSQGEENEDQLMPDADQGLSHAFGNPYVAPGITGSTSQYGNSGGLPAGKGAVASPFRTATVPQKGSSKRGFGRLVRILLIVAIILMVGGAAFAAGPGKGFLTRLNHTISTTPGAATNPALVATQPAGGQNQPHMNPTPKPTPSGQPSPTPSMVPSGQAITGLTPAMLPADWGASGRGLTDAAEALITAETFTQRLGTIDARSLQGTLRAAEFIMTQGEQARFLGQVQGVTADPRATDAFAAQVQQENLHQAAIILGAQLLQDQSQNGRFFAWVTVSYEQITQQGQGAPTMQAQQLTVLLVSTKFGGPSMGGIGWLVSGFAPGTVLPPIRTPA
jgi:hypothetical protein